MSQVNTIGMARVRSALSRTLREYRGSAPVELAETAVARGRFELDRARRRRLHGRPAPRLLGVVEQLNREGVAVIPDVVDPGLIDDIAAELESCLRRGQPLNRASDDRMRPLDDIAEPEVFLTDDELGKGEDHCRHLTNYLSVNQPLLACPSTVTASFLDEMIDVAGGYLGCLPAVGGLNLRKSFVNDLPDFDTLHFHSDRNSPRFLKFFVYLHDVDAEGGPFSYVRGSHREKFRGWRAKYRWTPQEIEARYGADRVAYMTARKGDMVIADTTGFHRGTKARSRDRSMLTVDYVVHPEFGDSVPRAAIHEHHFATLDERQRAVGDLLRVVPRDRPESFHE